MEAGAALAYTMGSMGVATLLPLGKLVVTCYVALAIFGRCEPQVQESGT